MIVYSEWMDTGDQRKRTLAEILSLTVESSGFESTVRSESKFSVMEARWIVSWSFIHSAVEKTFQLFQLQTLCPLNSRGRKGGEKNAGNRPRLTDAVKYEGANPSVLRWALSPWSDL